MCLLFCMSRLILRILVKKYCFLLFSEKYWCQHFCWDSRLIFLQNAWLPPSFFLNSNSFCKDLLFLHGANLAQKPPYLVGTVLNLDFLKYGRLNRNPNPNKFNCNLTCCLYLFFCHNYNWTIAWSFTEPMRKQWKKDKHRTCICLIMQFNIAFTIL